MESEQTRLTIVPISQAEAKAYVAQTHRHHKPPTGSVFQIAVANGAAICGVAMVGRPVARRLDDGWTLEVNRVATDGTRNACSKLYAAAWRVTRGLGYRKLITYTLASESGASLRGAGWRLIGEATTAKGQGWNVPSRPRVDTHPLQRKLKWVAPDDD